MQIIPHYTVYVGFLIIISGCINDREISRSPCTATTAAYSLSQEEAWFLAKSYIENETECDLALYTCDVKQTENCWFFMFDKKTQEKEDQSSRKVVMGGNTHFGVSVANDRTIQFHGGR